MKRTILLLLAVFVFVALLPAVFAEQIGLVAIFEFAQPPPDNIVQPVKFSLYKGENVACEESDVTLRQFECSVLFTAMDLTEDGTRVEAPFSLTATDNLGNETMHSNVVTAGMDISDLPPLPAPTSLLVVRKP